MALASETYEQLLAAARTLGERRAPLTAGYGGVDVINATLSEAGLRDDVSWLDMSVAQVHDVWDAYHAAAA